MALDDLNRLGQPIADVYEEITRRVIINLARYFKELKPGEQPGGAFEYQAQKLAELGQVSRETADIIGSMAGITGGQLQGALDAAILDALEELEKPLRDAARMGLITPAPDVPAELSPRMTRAFRLYYRQSADKLNLVNTVMLESTEGAYRATVSDITARMRAAQGILNTAAGEIITGAESFNQAQRVAVERMVENGITGYVDHGGHQWRPETYVAMDMRSTMHNASREAFWETNEQFGNDLFCVSQHPGARPLCYPWQCKVVAWKGEARDTVDGDGNPVHIYALADTTYGEPAGLFGINCGHHPQLFVEGVTKVPRLQQTEEQNAEAYAISQQHRKLERDFRDARLRIDVARVRGDETALETAQNKLARADERLDSFCEAHGRKRRREREYGPVNATWPAGS